MKRTFAAILCLILACLMLVSCGDDIIGDYINQYEEPTVKEKLKLNLYVIYEEGTTKNALDTVQQRIESYTLTEYETAVKVIYCTASEYEARILSAVKEGAAHKADIVLINSKSLMDKLMAGNYLADVTDYFNGKDYGTLNDKIASALIEASKREGTVVNNLGEESVADDRMYFVPNNRVVGTYEYIIINREMARNYYVSDNELKNFNSEEDAAGLKALIEADGLNADEYIKIVNGMYEDKAAYEAAGYACNIVSYPNATVEDAYEGGFAVVKTTKDVNRAMEIIYALSTDVTLHNYLTYGIPHTNYSVDDEGNVTRNSEGNSVYYMNPLYTGDVFTSYYCEELGWNEEAKTNGNYQNDDAYFFTEKADDAEDGSAED